jgi:hypothetical protein
MYINTYLYLHTVMHAQGLVLAMLALCCVVLRCAVVCHWLQAIHTAADLARIHQSKVTVLVVDHPGQEGDPTVKLQVINK